jgi:hypothetical protein
MLAALLCHMKGKAHDIFNLFWKIPEIILAVSYP